MLFGRPFLLGIFSGQNYSSVTRPFLGTQKRSVLGRMFFLISGRLVKHDFWGDNPVYFLFA